MNLCELSRGLIAVAATALASTILQAQEPVAAEAGSGNSAVGPNVDDDFVAPEIVVTSSSIRGAVDSPFPPELVLDADAVAAYGAGDLAELLDALAPQTATGRGRGGGAPVVLLNGRRVSGFREIRNLPSEAIEKVEILPEEVALQFGFSPDQRVVNVILKSQFAATTIEGELGGPFESFRADSEIEASWLRIDPKGRIEVSADYERTSALFESDRDIVQPEGDARFRTLVPRSDNLEIDTTINRQLVDGIAATVTASYERSDTLALLGLPDAAAITEAVDPLRRNAAVDTFSGGTTLDGRIGKWNWTLTTSLERAVSWTLTDRNFATPGDPGAPVPDRARSERFTANAIYTITGDLIELPAGAVGLNVRGGFEQRRLESQTIRAQGATVADFRRGEGNLRASVDVPLASAKRDVAGGLGELTANANIAWRRLTDFGSLLQFGYGLNWQPIDGLSVSASLAAEEAAPSQQQLGDPLILTPEVTIYDFLRGETVTANLLTGGNRDLLAEDRRDLKVGVTYMPPSIKGLTVSANYFRNRASNAIAAFPSLTLTTEAAFPDRIIRDASGALITVDQRPINYFATRGDSLRWGINFFRQIGNDSRDRRSGGRPSGARESDAEPPRGPGGFAGPLGRRGGGGGNRWQLSVFHSIQLRDEVQISPGLPVLDLLNGDAIGGSGGSPRHRVDVEGGWFHNGIGARVVADYRSPTRINGGLASDGSVAPTLRFSDLATVDVRLFVNFDQQPKLIAAVPFLKSSRLTLRIDNIFDARQQVRDDNGIVPIRYQPAYLDPLGRTFRISFRKQF